MTKRYRIGILLCTIMICLLYYASYQHMYGEKAMPNEKGTEPFAVLEAEAGREEGLYQYCLKEKDGVVCVYLKDGVTLHEKTSILIEQLPERIREEVRQGKYLRDEKELYDFLENYSS